MTEINSINHKIIFIAPIDWGLGHATRDIPLIRLLSKNNKVIIGVTKNNAQLFENYFPELQKINLPSYNIRYSKFFPVWLKILFQFPKINAAISAEKKCLEKIISENKIDIVISDNRFGLHNKHTQSIFITHQLQIKAPFFSSLATKINHNYIHQFDEVWVPDYEDKNLRLSGELSNSKGIKIPVKYIEPQSALKDLKANNNDIEKYDYLILLSGTEPQRSILENVLLGKFKNTDKKIVLIRGSERKLKIKNFKLKIIDFTNGTELKKLILGAETVICRSGYSTLMDLHLLEKKNLILIPTRGQTEQEYLAKYWKENFGANIFSATDFTDTAEKF